MKNRFTTTRTSLIRRFTKAGGDCTSTVFHFMDRTKRMAANGILVSFFPFDFPVSVSVCFPAGLSFPVVTGGRRHELGLRLESPCREEGFAILLQSLSSCSCIDRVVASKMMFRKDCLVVHLR